MRITTVAHSRDGYSIETYEVPVWARAVERAWMLLCDLTGNRLCGAGLGEWAWNLPLGRARREDDGFLVNSLAASLNRIEQAVTGWCYHREHGRVSVPCTADSARVLAPDFVDDCERIFAA